MNNELKMIELILINAKKDLDMVEWEEFGEEFTSCQIIHYLNLMLTKNLILSDDNNCHLTVLNGGPFYGLTVQGMDALDELNKHKTVWNKTIDV